HRVGMRLNHFVQQQLLLTGGDELAISNSPHCHINMCGWIGFFSFVQRGPVRICLEPGGIGGEVYPLAARRDCARIGRQPTWSGLVWSLVPLVFDLPSLRLGL